jgi:hypothetical protein
MRWRTWAATEFVDDFPQPQRHCWNFIPPQEENRHGSEEKQLWTAERMHLKLIVARPLRGTLVSQIAWQL